MTEKENISQEFRLKNIDETRNYFLDEIERNKLVNRKHKNICTTINYIEHVLILASIIIGYISFSAFPPLLGIPKGNTSYDIKNLGKKCRN